jgi:outer membrane protein
MKNLIEEDRSMKWFKTMVGAFILGLGLFFGQAAAQELVATGDVANTPTVVGLGIAVIPEYIGADEYRVAPLPYLKYTFRGSERYIKLAGPELSVNLLNSQRFYLGPLVRYYFARDDDVEDEVIKKMRKIDSGFSVGAFAAYEIKGSEPRNRLNFTLKFLTDASSEYDGWTMDFDVTLWRKAAPEWDVFIGAGTTFGDDDYMDTYFGVNSNNRGSATLAELSDFTAEKGIRDVRAQVGAIWYFAKNWLAGGLLRYQYLTSDAYNSPIVDKHGSPSQLAGAIFAGYRW